MINSSFSAKTALVVDDERFSLKIVDQILRSMGFRDVITAKDGGEALFKLTNASLDNIDLVVADFNMPQVTGLQFLKAIRIGTKGIPRELPVIMLTGNTDKHLVSAAINLDVDAFIAKPVSKNTLEGKIQRVFKANRAVKEAKAYTNIDVNVRLENPADEKVDIEHIGTAVKAPKVQAKQVLLKRVKEGSILARPICLSDGKIVVKAGTKVSDLLIEKMNDLNMLGEEIETVWIVD